MRHLEVHALVAGLGPHVAQPLCLKVVEGVVRVVAVHQVRHDAAQPDRVVGLRAAQRGQHRRILGGADAVAVQPGVHLDGDRRGATGALDRVEQFAELAHR